MRFIERKMQDIGKFFSKDILSLAILICLGIFLVNHLAAAEGLVRPANYNTLSLKPRKIINNLSSSRLSKQVQFHNGQSVSNWQMDLGVNAAQKNQGNTQYAANTETSYKLMSNTSLKTLLNYTTSTKNELQSDFSDLLMTLYFWKSKLGSNLYFMPFLISTLPLSKDSRQNKQMNLGYGGGIGLWYQQSLSLGRLTTASSLSIQKYSNKYESSLNNSINTSYSSNQQLTAGWEYKKIGLTGMFRHVNVWSYTDTTKDRFFHLQELNWIFNPKLSFSFGHSNSGGVLSPNQEDIEIRLIDETDSVLYISTNYVF